MPHGRSTSNICVCEGFAIRDTERETTEVPKRDGIGNEGILMRRRDKVVQRKEGQIGKVSKT